MSTSSGWLRRRRRRDDDEGPHDEAPEATDEPSEGRPRGSLDDLFERSRSNAPDPEADALEERLRQRPEGSGPSAAEVARDELAALLAETESQAEPGSAEPVLPPIPDSSPGLEIERDFRTPSALSRDPFDPPPAPRPPDPGPAPEPAAVDTPQPRPGSDPGESWDAIESLFTRRLEVPDEPEEEAAALQLEWERPEMFTEPTQEEILRRIAELSHGLELVEQRLEDLAKPLAEITEPGTRLAAAFKRLELIERSFEEMRLQSERNTLKIGSALSSLDTSMGELRASMEEPMWEISERLTSAELRLTELQASERLTEQINATLAKDPFDLVSTRDIDEVTENITAKVKRLGGRVERLEAALDRGLSGLEEARRAALSAAKELNKAIERANRDSARSRAGSGEGSPKAAAKKAPAKKASAKKSAAKRTTR